MFSYSGLGHGSLWQILDATGVAVCVSEIVDEFSLELEGRLFGFLSKFGLFDVVKAVDDFLDLVDFAGQFICSDVIFLVFVWMFLVDLVFSEIILAGFVDTWLLLGFLVAVLQLKTMIPFCLLS